MDLELNGRVTVITGCSVGTGREVAKVLAGEGVQTVVIARREDLPKTLEDEVVAAGGPRPLAMARDVTDPRTPQAVAELECAQTCSSDVNECICNMSREAPQHGHPWPGLLDTGRACPRLARARRVPSPRVWHTASR